MTKNFIQYCYQWQKITNILEGWDSLGSFASQQGSKAIGHVPEFGSLYYLNTIYAPLSEASIVDMERSISKKIPPILRYFFRTANGLNLFRNLSCYGYTFERDIVGQPISIRYGNVVEVPKDLPVGAVVIGAVTTKNVEGFAYIVALEDDSIVVTKKKSAFEIAASWDHIFHMLYDEANRLKVHFNEHGICDNEDSVLR